MIFVVEDDPNIRELVTYTLQSTGFDACGFENGSEFLKALSDGEKPELVLLDIMLPGEDGLEILKKLKNSSKTRNINFRKTSQEISYQRSADHYDDSKRNGV